MKSKKNTPKKGTKKTKTPNSDSFELDFGNRKISDQNSSKMVAIPKTALANCGCENPTEVNIKLIQKNGEKFLKFTPIGCKSETNTGNKK